MDAQELAKQLGHLRQQKHYFHALHEALRGQSQDLDQRAKILLDNLGQLEQYMVWLSLDPDEERAYPGPLPSDIQPTTQHQQLLGALQGRFDESQQDYQKALLEHHETHPDQQLSLTQDHGAALHLLGIMIETQSSESQAKRPASWLYKILQWLFKQFNTTSSMHQALDGASSDHLTSQRLTARGKDAPTAVIRSDDDTTSTPGLDR